MKFTAKLVGLLNGLQPVVGVAETGAKREYPDAFKVSLTAKQDGIIAEAHNGNVAITNLLKDQTNLDYVHAADGSVTVNAKDLLNTLSSFATDEVVDVSLNGNELVFVPQSDAEKLQTVPSEVRQIEMPKVATDFDSEITVNKGSLIEAANSVLFAIGFEKFRPEFLYWKLLVEPKKMRAVCGDGGRFPLYEIEGDNIVTAKKATTFLIYKEQNPALLKVLGTVDTETVDIKEFTNSKGADGLTDQFVIKVGSATVVLIGHDPGIKWPDETAFLTRPNTHKFVTKAADWNKEMVGVWATYNEDVRTQNVVHTTTLLFDTKKGLVYLKAENTMKSVRKVKLLDSVVPEGSDTIEFKCVTSILRDCIKQASGNIQMELIDPAKPMVVKYFAGDKVADGALHRTNTSTGTKEQYVMFFGAYNKKK